MPVPVADPNFESFHVNSKSKRKTKRFANRSAVQANADVLAKPLVLSSSYCLAPRMVR